MNKKEDALKLFLREFQKGSSTKWFKDKNYYKTPIYSYYLGDLQKTLNALAKDRMIRRMYPNEILDMDYKVPELKDECKSRGLKVSGKKADLINRLLEADPDLQKACEKRDDLWICTAIGLVIIDEYNEKIEQQEKDLQTLVFALLKEKRYKDAAKAVEQIRNSFVFPDWMPTDFTSQISLDYEEKEVEIIWNDTPKSLNKLKEAFLDKARYLISWDILRGTNTIRNYENFPTNVEGLSIGQTMQALMIYASGKMQLADWQKSRFVKGVQIASLTKDTVLCPECQKLTGKTYDFRKVPVIPNEKCKNSVPCPLCYFADIDIDKPKRKGFLGLFK